MEWMDPLFHISASTLRVSTPLVFAALGGLICERSGVTNIALEGMMLIGAFAGTSVALSTQSAWLGAGGAIIAGIIVAFLYAFFVIELRADQIVAGMAVNIFAVGITPFLSKIFYHTSTSTPSLPLALRFQSAPMWAAWIFVFVIWAWIRFTPWVCGYSLQVSIRMRWILLESESKECVG